LAQPSIVTADPDAGLIDNRYDNMVSYPAGPFIDGGQCHQSRQGGYWMSAAVLRLLRGNRLVARVRPDRPAV
jgi:hypothetical protein